MSKRIGWLMVVGLVLGLCASVHADNYKIDPVHSSIAFRVIHLNVAPFYGRFSEPSGMVISDEDPAKMSVEVHVPVEKIQTGNDKRDQDLKSQTWLGTKQ